MDGCQSPLVMVGEQSMPRAIILLSPGEKFLALLGRELSPDVTGRGHGLPVRSPGFSLMPFGNFS
jgi:hypothetical protein